MINDRAQPIYIYPDQLITETWPDWVENILLKTPAAENRNSRGFQELAGLDNSTVRTRAGEAYRIGLLLHRVIREREEGSSTPKGWEYVCNDRSVVSKTGYLSYALGKALSANSKNPDIAAALSVIYLLFALSLGTGDSGKSVSTALIYRRVIQCFEADIGPTEYDAHSEDYERILAAAVFQTLDDPTARVKLIDEYIVSDHISTLILVKDADKSVHRVTVDDLVAKFAGKASALPSANEVPRAKAALFWAAPGRGIFTKGESIGEALMDALVPLDRASIKETGRSLLDPALRVQVGQEHLLLENLNSIFTNLDTTSKKWGSLMEILTKGVYSALAYLEDSVASLPKPKQFHLHGVPYFEEGASPLTLEIEKEGVPIRPDTGALVLIRNIGYRVTNVDENQTKLKIRVELVSSSAPVPN